MPENNEPVQIDIEKVTNNITRFIQNHARCNVYIRAPSYEAVSKYFYAKDVLDYQYKPLFSVSELVLSRPSTIANAKLMLELERVTHRDFLYAEDIITKTEETVFMFRDWKDARFFEEKSSKGLRKLFFWNKLAQKYCDSRFSKFSRRAYEWLQEDKTPEQHDLKNRVAIFGFWCLDQCNQHLNNPQTQAPLDTLVREQIRRIPPETIDKCFKEEDTFKWVYGDRVLDTDFNHTTFEDIYGQELAQSA